MLLINVLVVTFLRYGIELFFLASQLYLTRLKSKFSRKNNIYSYLIFSKTDGLALFGSTFRASFNKSYYRFFI